MASRSRSGSRRPFALRAARSSTVSTALTAPPRLNPNPVRRKHVGVRAARLSTKVGDLARTLVVVESDELFEGQKRAIAAASTKAKADMTKLERLAASGRIRGEALKRRATKALRCEHLAGFVITSIGGTEEALLSVGSRRRQAPGARTYAPRQARNLHGPVRLDERAHRDGVWRTVERAGDLSAVKEGRRRALGPVPPVGRCVATHAHLRDLLPGGERMDLISAAPSIVR